MSTDVSFIGGRGIFSNYGGVENAIREVAVRMVNQGLTVDVYGITSKENKFQVPKGLTSITAPGFFYRRMGQYGQVLYAILQVIFIRRPKVVYIFASGPCIFTPILRICGIKVITSLRAIDSQRNKWGFVSRTILRIGEYFAWRFSNEFTVNSKEMYDYYYPKNKDINYIPNGATAAKLGDLQVLEDYELKAGEYYLFAARLDPVKRLDLLLKAYKQLPKELKYPLVVAGGHSKDEEYENYLSEIADENVCFIGHVPSETLDPLMRECRVFILPSVLEGMSNSLLTAMISEKPVLVANVRANSDVVENFDPVLFEPDNQQDLLEKLITLSSDDVLRLNVSSKMRAIASSNFTWDKTAGAFTALAMKHLEKIEPIHLNIKRDNELN